jgi:hypothetical protein
MWGLRRFIQEENLSEKFSAERKFHKIDPCCSRNSNRFPRPPSAELAGGSSAGVATDDDDVDSLELDAGLAMVPCDEKLNLAVSVAFTRPVLPTNLKITVLISKDCTEAGKIPDSRQFSFTFGKLLQTIGTNDSTKQKLDDPLI